MEDFNVPDLNAPRYRCSVLDILDKSFYKEFREKYPEYGSITDKEIKEIIKLVNGVIWKTAITERDGVEFPSGLGYLFVGTCNKKKSLNTDYRMSREYMKKIEHRNWESDQYIAKIFYTNYEQKYRFKFHELWGFTGVRQFKRELASYYPEHWKQYIQVDNMLKISRLFRKQSFKMNKLKEERDLLQFYDEFDMD